VGKDNGNNPHLSFAAIQVDFHVSCSLLQITNICPSSIWNGRNCRHFEDSDYVFHNKARKGHVARSAKLFRLERNDQGERSLGSSIFILHLFLEDILQYRNNATHLPEVMIRCEILGLF